MIDPEAQLQSFHSPELNPSDFLAEVGELVPPSVEEEKRLLEQVESVAKDLLHPTIFSLSPEALTNEIKQKAPSSKIAQLKIATKLADLVSNRLNQRRASGKKIPQQQQLNYSKETQKMQTFFTTVQTVRINLGPVP